MDEQIVKMLIFPFSMLRFRPKLGAIWIAQTNEMKHSREIFARSDYHHGSLLIQM